MPLESLNTKEFEKEESISYNKSTKKKTIGAKKGKKVNWRPASLLGELEVPDGFRGRWCRNDPENIERKKKEGWVILDDTISAKSGRKNHAPVDGLDGGPLDGTIRHRELIAMILPEEVAEARSEYFRKETLEKTKSTLVDEPTKNNAKVTITD